MSLLLATAQALEGQLVRSFYQALSRPRLQKARASMTPERPVNKRYLQDTYMYSFVLPA